MTKLSDIQAKVKAPKGQFNAFGKYKYRSAEDILESVKPVIHGEGFHLTLEDDIILIGDRYYVKATASLSNGDQTFTATALAREEGDKKGMDGAQVTGAASSYARKYALNGLFALDDTKDADATNKHGKDTITETRHLDLITKFHKAETDVDLLELSAEAKDIIGTLPEDLANKVRAAYTAAEKRIGG